MTPESDASEVIEAWENENVGDPRYDIEVEAVREFVSWLKAEGWRIVKLGVVTGYDEGGDPQPPTCATCGGDPLKILWTHCGGVPCPSCAPTEPGDATDG